MADALRDGVVRTTGTDIAKLMSPVSLFGGGQRTEKRQQVIDKLKAFFDKYFGLQIEDEAEEKAKVYTQPQDTYSMAAQNVAEYKSAKE